MEGGESIGSGGVWWDEPFSLTKRTVHGRDVLGPEHLVDALPLRDVKE